MATDYTFMSWSRPGMSALGTAEKNGRLEGELALSLVADGRAIGQSQTTFWIAGPADITKLEPEAIAKVSPPAETGNAQPEHSAYVELSAEDLAWRHTPEVNPDLDQSSGLKPWLVLVVGEDKPEQMKIEGGKLQIGPTVRAAHPLSQSAGWAHVQVTEAGSVCRILSPARPPGHSKILAALVPAWVEDTQKNVVPAWTDSDQVAPLPLFHHWRYQTGESGDFRALIQKLKAAKPLSKVNGLPLIFDAIAPSVELVARGAIAPAGSKDDDMPAAVQDRITALRKPLVDDAGREAPTLPNYGDNLVADVLDTAWGKQLNSDPRHRVASGVGATVAVLEQDMLVEAVMSQLGDVSAVSHTITRAAMGLNAARRLWDKRFPDAADPMGQLQIFGPALRRMPTAAGSALESLTDNRPLSAAMFSTAARRALRPGTAITKQAQPDAAQADAILREANRCLQHATPKDPERIGFDAAQMADAEALPRENLDALFEQINRLKKLWTSLPEFREFEEIPFEKMTPADIEEMIFAIERGRIDKVYAFLDRLNDREPGGQALFSLAEILSRPSDRPQCQPADLAQAAESLAAAIDPTAETAWIRQRALGQVNGTVDEGPFEVCTSLQISAWRLLRDHALEWLLPSSRDLLDDTVTLFESNPTFVQAFLAGLNHRLVAELRWRGLPIQRGCTPIRRFWDSADVQKQRPVDDISSLRNWSQPLGDMANAPPEVTGKNLILVLKSELFRRFPDTLIYAVPAQGSQNSPDFTSPPDPSVREGYVWPIFQGSAGPGTAFFGFPLTASQARAHWLVIEQAPIGLRFRNVQAPQALSDPPPTSGAAYAEAAVEQRIRVMLRGDLMVEGA
ncbi:MAG: hypothetical protein AAFZ17_00695 [Cyanobacteria bacterium J06650_10]